jgi:hypothetical protein
MIRGVLVAPLLLMQLETHQQLKKKSKPGNKGEEKKSFTQKELDFLVAGRSNRARNEATTEILKILAVCRRGGNCSDQGSQKSKGKTAGKGFRYSIIFKFFLITNLMRLMVSTTS